MIKIKLMNYDASEYKMLQEDLNHLASLGYTCHSIDYITIFKKTNKKAHYVTDIFVSNASTQYSKRREKDDWISNYIDCGYQNIGNIRNIYIFKGTNKNKHCPSLDANVGYRYFKGPRTLLKIFWLLVTFALMLFFVPNVFSNTAITEFITNGSIIIHYIPVPLCLILVFRAFINYYNTNQIKQKLKNKQEPILTNQSKYRTLRYLYIYVLLFSFLALIIGIALDSLDRKKVVIDTTKVLTLEAFNLPSNTQEYPTYTTKSSLLIPYSYSYFEQSGELDVEKEEYGNLLSINYYQAKDTNLAKAFANNIIDYPRANNASKIELLNGYKNVYLSYSLATNVADTMIIIQDKTLIFVATSFDLTDIQYQKVILDFYVK